MIIGNEILSGRTQDANLKYVAEGLNEAGIRLKEARVIPDDKDVIVRTVRECSANFDYVLTSGGIGPTHDDITTECVADAFNVKVIRHPEAGPMLKAFFESRDVDPNPARMKMANVPEGAEIIENPISVAPGYRMENVYVMAGIPKVMQAMFDIIKQDLKGGRSMMSRTLTCDLTEGALADGLSDLQAKYPNVDIGSYPFFRSVGVGVSVVLRSEEETVLDQATDEVRKHIIDLGGTPEEGEPGDKQNK